MHTTFGGKLSRFTKPSKFDEPTNTEKMAQEAIREGETLRRMLHGKRILIG